ncbi:MAG TPA: thymidine phosphorylase, partial [bacterium]|nr:thymidine phosphorylase [bacterium]
GKVDGGLGVETAESILNDGRALKKFQAICEAQGGMREPSRAKFSYVLEANIAGQVTQIDNRKLARVAKFAGAPAAPAAGVEIHIRLGDRVERGQPLLSIFAETKGELAYSFNYLSAHLNLIEVTN